MFRNLNRGLVLVLLIMSPALVFAQQDFFYNTVVNTNENGLITSIETVGAEGSIKIFFSATGGLELPGLKTAYEKADIQLTTFGKTSSIKKINVSNKGNICTIMFSKDFGVGNPSVKYEYIFNKKTGKVSLNRSTVRTQNRVTEYIDGRYIDHITGHDSGLLAASYYKRGNIAVFTYTDKENSKTYYIRYYDSAKHYIRKITVSTNTLGKASYPFLEVIYDQTTGRVNKITSFQEQLATVYKISENGTVVEERYKNVPIFADELKDKSTLINETTYNISTNQDLVQKVADAETLLTSVKTPNDYGLKLEYSKKQTAPNIKSTPDKTNKIYFNTTTYKKMINDELTRDAATRFLTLNFGENVQIAELLKKIETIETKDLLILSLLTFAEAQADKSITTENMNKIDVSFISVLIQPGSSTILDKISVADVYLVEAGTKDIVSIITITEGLKTLLSALDKVEELKLDKTTKLQPTKYDLTDPKILEKIGLENPEFKAAYELFRIDCSGAIEAGKKY